MRRSHRLCTTFMLLAATAIPGVAAHADSEDHYKRGPVVYTTDGPVRGFVAKGVNTFLGIPYAAPPVGDLRWMPPERP